MPSQRKRPPNRRDWGWPLRDVEFLPAWYPRIQRRRRAVVVQGWVTLAVVVLFLGVALGKRWELRRAGTAAIECSDQISESQKQLARLNEKLQYEAQLRQQEEIIAKLGLDVDATRLMNALEAAMPRQMALTELTEETDETTRTTPNDPGRRGRAVAAKPVSPLIDRRLKVRMDGVCPTDVELATLLARLSAVKFFDDVALAYTRDGVKDGHVMREFEVSFSVNLNAPVDDAGGGAVAEGK